MGILFLAITSAEWAATVAVRSRTEGTPTAQLPEGQSLSESREVAARVLNARALASLVMAITAFLVMGVSWLASGHDNAPRDWPAAGWLICLPTLAAALVLVSAAESMGKPPS